jgi:O-6-methylguanine DNA methyltransferase
MAENRSPADPSNREEAPMTDPEETLYVSFIMSRFGLVGIASSARGIVRLSFPLEREGSFRKRLIKEYPRSRLSGGGRENAEALRQVSLYLEGGLREFDLQLDLRGSAFRRKVLIAVGKIPYGSTASYGDIARRVGSPGGARAVGQAVGANPIPLIIPCHRVIASNGALGGFGLGLPVKRRLLDLERSDR